LTTGRILDNKNTILLESLRRPPTGFDYELVKEVLSVMYITDPAGCSLFTRMFLEGEK
jgi:hypothetical protein